MANLALHKRVEEGMINSGEATNGNTKNYTGRKGFASFRWPGTLTVDLDGGYQISWIRLLLWDGLGQGGDKRNPRIYKYRLLTSTDHVRWSVHYDIGKDGYNGWQVFEFKKELDARYIRVHGLWNSANIDFHVVQLEAHNAEPPPIKGEETLHKIISMDSTNEELGEGLPLTLRMSELIGSIEDLVANSGILKPEPFHELTSELRVQVGDIAAVESSMGSVRRVIITPVQDQLKKLKKFSVLGFWVGLVGGILAIITFVMTLIFYLGKIRAV